MDFDRTNIPKIMFKFITKRHSNNHQEKSKFAIDNFVFYPKTTLK
jgi:hypothetical protein